MADLRAIIFDFDGTIADSEPLHLAAFQAVLSEELDLDLTEEEYAERYLAFDDRLLFTHVLNDRGVAVDPDRFEQLLEQKEARYQEIALAPQILPGAAEMIRAAAGHWPLAIASGALGHEVRPVLERVGLIDCFPIIVTAEMVGRGKPDPESFLTALARINENLADPIPRSFVSRGGGFRGRGALGKCRRHADARGDDELSRRQTRQRPTAWWTRWKKPWTPAVWPPGSPRCRLLRPQVDRRGRCPY